MTTQDNLSPDQFGKLRGGDMGLRGRKIATIAKTLYAREPEFMGRLESDIRENGLHNPVHYSPNGPTIQIDEGHHRAAAAYRAGANLPLVQSGTNAALNEDRDHTVQWQRSRTPQEHDARLRLGDR
jgi:ParB-like nuclease family protein